MEKAGKESVSMRYEVLDTIRGINLVSMILYHGMWDVVNFFHYDIPWYEGIPGYIWQQSICWVFVLLSGFCWSIGRRKVLRGFQVFLAGLLVTMFTLIFMPEERIVFGILTFLGSAMLLMIPIEKMTTHVPAAAGMSGSFFLFLITKPVSMGFLGLCDLPLWRLPVGLYRNLLTTYLGFPENNFFSNDYFPLIPWLFLFMMGQPTSERQNDLKAC